MKQNTFSMQEFAKDRAEIYRVFSNEKRVLIFWLLANGEMAVNEISDAINSSIQNTSQHLRLMKAKNILDSRRDGQTIYYRIANSEIGNYCLYIHQENLEGIRNNHR